MTPRIVAYGDRPVYISKEDAPTEVDVLKMLSIPGVPKSSLIWNGHEFEIGDVSIGVGLNEEWRIHVAPYGDTMARPSEQTMHGYFPVDLRTNEKDWRRAIKAYPNETNTAWLPEHCDNDHMVDREVELRAGLVGVLQPFINKLDVSVHTATDSKPSNWPLGIPWETRTVRRLKLQSLIDFLDKALECLLTEARDRPIGWYHQNPHESHLHNLIRNCILSTLNNPNNNFSTITSEVNSAATGLATHKYERAWDRRARLRPKIVTQISDIQSLAGGSPSTVDLSNKFSTIKGTLTFSAESSDADVAPVSVEGSTLTVRPLTAGSADITVRATGVEDLYVEQNFMITVAASN